MGLRRWLDPPEKRERKRRIRAGLLPRPGGLTVTDVSFAVPMGCMVPLAIATAVLVGAGFLMGQRSQPGSVDHITVRVIDDGAVSGPKIVSTQVVPLR